MRLRCMFCEWKILGMWMCFICFGNLIWLSFLGSFSFSVPCWNKRASLMEICTISFDIFHLLYIPCLKNMCDSFLSVFAVYAMRKFSQLIKSHPSLAFFEFYFYFLVNRNLFTFKNIGNLISTQKVVLALWI